MGKAFNPPPNWPRPPEGWIPEHGWTPDPNWGPTPAGWELYVDDVEPGQSSATPTGKPQGDSTGKRRKWEVATNWVTTVTAVVALVLSVVTYVQLNSAANVHLIMPQQLRIAAPNSDGYQNVYLQPTFTASRRTDRPAVLMDMTLLFEPQETGGDMPLYSWHEVVELTQVDGDQGTTVIRKRLSDPTPLLIFGTEPISPMIWFLPAEPNPQLTVGTLQATLLVEWEDRPSMIRDFCIDISQEVLDHFAEPTDPVLFYRFIKYETSECYFLP